VSNGTAAHRPAGLQDQISTSLLALWVKHAGAPPSAARTTIAGNEITCELEDAGGAGSKLPTAYAYRREAIAIVTRLTHRRVAAFTSLHDRASDVATVTLTLHPSLGGAVPMPSGRRARIRHRARA
jgi:hypothetical protein